MSGRENTRIAPAEGKLGVLIPGIGAVNTTFIGGAPNLAPMTAPGPYPEHDIFIQLMKLKNTLRWMRGEDLITHFGLQYYD